MNNFKDYYKILGIKKHKLDLEMKRRRKNTDMKMHGILFKKL